MNRGRFLQVGDPEEVYAHPRTAFVADFLGSANVFGARVVGADPPTIEIPGGPVLPLVGAHVPLRVGQEGEFAVRPEALRLDRQGGHPTDAGPQAISGILLTRARVGGLDDLRVRVGELVWRVRSRAPRSEGGPAVGDTVTLFLDPADLIPLVPDDLAEGAP
jgi:ABC-type Fe3+/spermidine/putrescine transport system ATPase subunit